MDALDGVPRLCRADGEGGAGDIGDAVLAAPFLDHNQGHAGGLGLVARDGTSVNALGVQVGAASTPEVVVAQRAEHRGRGAGAGGRDGLVRALAAAKDGERAAGDRFASGGRFGHARHEVGVDGPGYQDWTSSAGRHAPLSPPVAAEPPTQRNAA